MRAYSPDSNTSEKLWFKVKEYGLREVILLPAHRIPSKKR
jgi:hypothetical protein